MSNENTRIYLVTETIGDVYEEHLVRAGSQAQAIRHVVSERFTADVASPDDCVRLAGAGKKLREATA